ncbi:MAG: nucleotide exchange factor GrpE [Ruminococcaceae bacterium]|nr:nucleotide exchange factor GrpE [Oscillospiraceae bacterium]
MAEEKNMDKIDLEETVADNEATSDSKEKKEKKSEIKKLKSELEEAKKALEAERAKAEEINDKYLRIAAEYDNFRKRTQTERKNVYGEAVADTLGGLLPIIDNLQYAAKYSAGDAEKVAEGLNLILGKLPETLERMNIKAFGEPGETFDPNLHNAILHIDDENLGEGEIVEVLQQGYMYGERVLRYAMVKVAN